MVLILYLTLKEQYFYMHIIYHFHIIIFGYYYIYICDTVVDSFRHMAYISYMNSAISLTYDYTMQ